MRLREPIERCARAPLGSSDHGDRTAHGQGIARDSHHRQGIVRDFQYGREIACDIKEEIAGQIAHYYQEDSWQPSRGA